MNGMLRASIVVTGAMLLNAVASAAVVPYSDRAAFLAAAGPTATESFDSIGTDESFVGSPVTIAGMTFTATAGPNPSTQRIDASPFQSNGSFSNGTTYVLGEAAFDVASKISSEVRIAYADGVTAWGADFTGLNAGGGVVITVFGPAGNELGQLDPPAVADETVDSFYGFTSTAPVGFIIFRHVPSAQNDDIFGLDNATYSVAPSGVAAVPEPASLPLIAIGLVAYVGVRRRRVGRFHFESRPPRSRVGQTLTAATACAGSGGCVGRIFNPCLEIGSTISRQRSN